MKELERAAEAAADCVGIVPGDDVLVLCNEPQRAIADALVAAAASRARAVRLLEYPALSRHGEEPPHDVVDAMEEASVILAVTVFSISHTRARLEASGRGARIASMPALDDEIFARALPTDYALLEREGGRMAAALTAATTCRVTSPAGTDVVLDLAGRAGISDDGRLQATGAFGNLPAGEAFIAPVETSGDGSIVIDGALGGYGIPRPPLRLHVEAGRIVRASGGASDWLLETLDAGGETGRAIAELGIGTNPAAILSGGICEDEKVAGTAHIAFGTNASFGGVNVSTVHIDGVLLRPTVELDGRTVMRDGRPQEPAATPAIEA